MKIIYIDTETTGLNPSENALIQVAGTISADGVTEDFDIRMAPGPNDLIDQQALLKTGLTFDIIKKYQSSAEGYQKFIELLSKYVDKYSKQDKFYFVGYNSNFDVDFIRAWFLKNKDNFFGSYFWNPPLDVMQLAAFHLIGKRHLLENFKLGTVYKYFFGENFEDAHEAGADIRATKRILNHILAEQKRL